jgi:hypothetical protein
MAWKGVRGPSKAGCGRERLCNSRSPEHALILSALYGPSEAPAIGAVSSSAMAKKPTKPRLYSWNVYHLASKQKFVGIVHDQPDADAATKAAIEEHNVPANERGRLMAQR